jgi:hypothetical protein
VLATIALFEGTEDEPVVETPHGTILDPGGSAPGGTMGFGGGETNRGEARWHGVCLALAEMARRGLVRDQAVGGAVQWVLKVCHPLPLIYLARHSVYDCTILIPLYLAQLTYRLSHSTFAAQPIR